VQYDSEVKAEVDRYARLGTTVDPLLVHAIIQRESSHGVTLEVVEPNGHHSYGPMMVLDDTATAYGYIPTDLRDDPGVGIVVGVRYLVDLMRRFPGDVQRAISAYNTGPGNANRNAAGKFPNQTYVDAVNGWWRLYGGGAVGAAGVVLGVMVGLFLLLRAARGRVKP
jgi:hypothetical protein